MQKRWGLVSLLGLIGPFTLGTSIGTVEGGGVASAAPAPSVCTRWSVGGTWNVSQSNAIGTPFTFQFTQHGYTVGGTATIGDPYSSLSPGTIAGTISGNSLDFIVTWHDGSQGGYQATETAGNLVNGNTFAIGDSASTATWSATGPGSCSTWSAGVGYDSIPGALPGNLPSLAMQATQSAEIGNEVSLAGPGPLRHVTVTLSSWACQSGSWTTDDCVTTPGATFTEPITLNLYKPPAANSDTPGTLITSVTQTFKVPYRPSWSSKCIGTSDPGGWYDGSQGCYDGLATNVEFVLGSGPITLPTTFVYGISYPTSQYGNTPYGALACESTAQGCPYDSLNVALSSDPTDVTIGADPNPGTIWWNTQTATDYCDHGAAGSGFFREDSPGAFNNCWSANSMSAPWLAPYFVPAVHFAS